MICPYCSGQIEVARLPLSDVDPEVGQQDGVPVLPVSAQPMPRLTRAGTASNLNPQPTAEPLQISAHAPDATIRAENGNETADELQPVATEPARLTMSAWDNFLGGVEDLYPHANAFFGRTLCAGKMLVDECRRVWQFYRQHAVAMWLNSPIESWLDLGLIDPARTVVVPGDELANNDDRLIFPATCVICGESSEEPFVSEERSIPDVRTSARIVTAGIIAASLIWWLAGFWSTALTLAIVLWGASRLGVQRSIEIRFARCSRHARNRKDPQLFFVSDGLFVRVGSRLARDQFDRLLQGEPIDTAAACGDDSSE
jgi:hypothetical protein